MKNLSSTSSSDRRPSLPRFFAGVLLVVALAAAAQYAIDALWPPEIPPIIRGMPGQCGRTLVFLGDSINASYDHSETDSKPLSALIGWYADHRIGTVALGGYDMRLFRDYIRAMAPRLSPDDPHTWILTVNLANYRQDGRTPWNRNKLNISQLRQYLSRTYRAFARPMRIFQFPSTRPDLRPDEDAHRPVLWQGRSIGRNRDFPDTRFKVANVTDDLRRENLVIRYGQPLASGNLVLRATTEAARMLTRRGQRAVFCIMPCDVERCDALLDGQISPILDAKAAAAAEAARAGGGEVLDLHSAFPHELFIPDQYPNEHLRNAGRSRLAIAIADFLSTNAPPAAP